MPTVFSLLDLLLPRVSPLQTRPRNSREATASWSRDQVLPADQTPQNVFYRPSLAVEIAEQLYGHFRALQDRAATHGESLPEVPQALFDQTASCVREYGTSLASTNERTVSSTLETLLRSLRPALVALEIVSGNFSPESREFRLKLEHTSPLADEEKKVFGASVRDDIIGGRLPPHLAPDDSLETKFETSFVIEVKHPKLSLPPRGLLVRSIAELERLAAGGAFLLSEMWEEDVKSLYEKPTFSVRVRHVHLFVVTDAIYYTLGITRNTADPRSPTLESRRPFNLFLSSSHPLVPTVEAPSPPPLLLILLAFLFEKTLDLEPLLAEPQDAAAASLVTRVGTLSLEASGGRDLRRSPRNVASRSDAAFRGARGPRTDESAASGGAASDTSGGKKGEEGRPRADVVEFSSSLSLYDCDEILVIYPNGDSSAATRSFSPPSPQPSSSSAATASAPGLTSSSSSSSSASSSPQTPHTSPSAPERPLPHPRRLALRVLTAVAPSSKTITLIGFDDAREQRHGFVLKQARKGQESHLRAEATLVLGSDALRRLRTSAVPSVALFETEDGLPVLLSEWGGLPVSEWTSLSLEQRQHLFLSLLRIHQIAHLHHGDPSPANAVVATDSDAALPRWIDFGHARTGHDCPGSGCGELEDLLYDLELDGESERAELAVQAVDEGLRWM
ncbi:hypothetical protein JCM6882_009153 [Rhodosporidiobolus microsporus]